MAQLLPSLDYLAPKLAAAAVLAVVAENEVSQHVLGFPPAAPEWGRNSDLRADLFKRTRDAWCRLAGKDFTWFPYSPDYVVLLYTRAARQPPAVLAAWRAEVKVWKKGER